MSGFTFDVCLEVIQRRAHVICRLLMLPSAGFASPEFARLPVFAYDPTAHEYYVQGLEQHHLDYPNDLTWVPALALLPHFDAVVRFHGGVRFAVDEGLLAARYPHPTQPSDINNAERLFLNLSGQGRAWVLEHLR